MPKLVTSTAKLKCNQGLSPGTLTVLTTNQVGDSDKPAATVNDYIPMTNIGAFGMCKSMANPQVAAATSAAQGTLTPQPCTPVVTSAWSPGSSTVTVNDLAALTDDSKCSCTWAGQIEITDAGASDVDLG